MGLMLWGTMLLWSEDVPEHVLARLTRLADPVVFIDGEAQAEKTLFHWQKSVWLRSGDGVRQGVAGCAELFFPDDQSEVRLYGRCEVMLPSAQQDVHVIRLRRIGRVVFRLKGVRTRIELPGGTTLEGSNSWLRLSKDEMGRRLVLRNAGPGEIAVSGPIQPVGVAAVAAGHVVQLPFLHEEPPEGKDREDHWEGRLIRLGPGVEATKTDTELFLDGSGVARVGGARIRLPAKGRIRIWKPRP